MHLVCVIWLINQSLWSLHPVSFLKPSPTCQQIVWGFSASSQHTSSLARCITPAVGQENSTKTQLLILMKKRQIRVSVCAYTHVCVMCRFLEIIQLHNFIPSTHPSIRSFTCACESQPRIRRGSEIQHWARQTWILCWQTLYFCERTENELIQK